MADVFALRNAGLDAFLHSDVGTEANGSRLTILSLLARLGKDPWVEAALWSQTSKAAAADALAQSIALTPLSNPSESARSTAMRLVDLLPNGPGSRVASMSVGSERASLGAVPRTWIAIACALICLLLAASLGLNLKPNAAAVTPPQSASTPSVK